jgi:hypothetical protein
MALDARSRTSIYQKLIPILGDDDANKLMSEFPSVEADELVTKQFLRAELAELRAEMAGLAGGLRGEMADLAGGLRGDMHAMEMRIMVRMGAAMLAQTTLLVAAMSLLR